MKNPTAPALKVCYKRPLLPGSITHRKFFLPAVALFLAALLGSINGASAQMVEVQIDPSSLDTTYDGTPKEAIVTTNPPGAYVMVTYNGDPTPPTNAGSYDVEATISDSTYYGSACATLTIAKAELGLEASNLTQTYNGTYLPITIKAAAGQSNLPASIGVSYSNQSNPYGWPGSGSSYAQYSLNGEYYTLDPASLPYPPATDAANYSVSISFDDPNYQSSASFWLTVNKAQLSDFISVPSQNIPYDSYGNWPSIYNVNFLKSFWLGTLNVSIQGNYVSPSSKSYTSSWDNYYQNPGYLYPDNNSGYPYNYSIYLQSTGYWESGNWISYSGQYPGYPGPTTQPYTISITSTNPNIEGEVTAQLDVAAHKVNFSNYGEQSYEYDGTYKIPYIQAFNSDYPYHYGGYNIPDIIALSYSTYYSPWIYNNVFYASRGYYYGYPYYGYPYYGYGNDYQLIPPGSPLPYWGGTQPTRIPIPSPGSHTLNVDAADPMNSWSRNYIGSSSYQFQVYHKNVYFEVTGNAPSENSRPVVEAQASDGYISVPISLSGVIVYDQNGDPVGTHPPDISVTYSPVNGGSDIVATYSTNPATYGVSNSFTYYPSPSNPPTPPGEYNVRIQPIYPNWNYQYWEQQNFFNFHGFSDSNMIVAKLRVLGNTTVAPDTDGDGVNDYREALDGSNPNDANSFNSLSKGLGAHFDFNGDLLDKSGRGNHGADFGGGSFTEDRFGNSNSARFFDGVDDYIDVGNPIGNNPPELTQSAWFKILSRGDIGTDTLITKRHADDGVDWASLCVGGWQVIGQPIFSLDDQSYRNDAISPDSIDLNEWAFVCGVKRGAVYELYVNGVLKASITDYRSLDGSNFTMHLMHHGAWNYYTNGVLDDVRVYNRALTAEEVSQLYTQESRPSNPPVIFESSLYTTVPGPSWTDAEANAQKLGGHLVAINSEEENDFLWAEFSNATKYRIRPNAYDAPEVFSHWIGLTDDGHEGDWKWSNGEPLTFVNAFWEDFEGISQPDQNWARVSWNVPASWTGNIETRGLWQRHNLYAYQNGNETPTGIAEIPFVQRGDSIYVVVEGPTWDEAQANAQKLGGNLVTVNDAAENEFLYSHFWGNFTAFYIGLSDAANEGEWKWADGSPVNFTNWAPNEPSNNMASTAGEDYAQIIFDGSTWQNNRYWNDISNEYQPEVHLTTLGIAEIKITEAPAPDMIFVQGGTLPVGSELAGQQVGDFEIGKYEVTWDEWQEVRDWAVANGYSDLTDVGAGTAGNHPVQQVSWYDLIKWSNSKSEREGLTPVYSVNGTVYRTGEFGLYGSTAIEVNNGATGYRLPSEAEWEWAARGGINSQGYIYSGSNDVNVVVWFYDNSSEGSKAVGTKAPNELSIHDMSGNVWEWCWDVHDLYSHYRSIRGGSRYNPADFCTVAIRGNGNSPAFRHDSLGFRLARSSPQTIQLATPSITTAPIVSPILLGSELSNATISGGVASVNGTAISGNFTFANPQTQPPLGNSTQPVVFTPADTGNYTTATTSVTVTVLDPTADEDGDGLNNSEEFTAGTNPLVGDTDGDGFTDGEETDAGSNPLLADSKPDWADSDGDGVTDYREVADGTNPNDQNSFASLSKGLVAFYPLDGNGKDETGNGYDVSGGNLTFASNRNNQQNQSLVLDSAFSVEKTIFLDASAPRTFSQWVKVVDYPANTGPWTKPYASHVRFPSSVVIGNGFAADGEWWLDTGWGVAFYDFPLTTNWVQIVVVYEGDVTQAKIYRNGTLVPLKRWDFTKKQFDSGQYSPLSFWGNNHASFSNLLDDVRVYNRALSAAEVSQLYSEESGEPNMVLVEGGTLPAGSAFANQAVPTFQIARFETTWAEWKKVRTWAAANGYDISAVGQSSADNHPVRNINWYDAVKWCNAKSEMEGLVPAYSANGTIFKIGQPEPTSLVQRNPTASGYRLPKEIEWEWAARGAEKSQNYTFSGSNDLNSVAWNYWNSNGALEDLGWSGRGTWPVGQKLPNEIGIYDANGNLWEWCEDIVATNNHPLRGGSWSSFQQDQFALSFRDYRNGAGNRAAGGTLRYARNVKDQIPPVVSLQGSNPMFIYKGANFTDPGANVTDNVDFPQTIFGNGIVNTSVLGNYTLTYTASDFSGNDATPVERIVQVVLDPEGDEDGDGLKNSLETNTGEFVSGNNTGTNPLLADTNGDGFSDGEAVNWGLNPLTDYSAVIGLVKHLSTNDPGRFDLYTTGAIMDMNLGNLVIHKSGNQVMLNLQIQSTPDLGVQPFTNHGSPMQMPVTMPGNKGFLRVRALGAE